MMLLKWITRRTMFFAKARLGEVVNYNDTAYILTRSFMLRSIIQNGERKMAELFSCFVANSDFEFRLHLQPCWFCALFDFSTCLQAFSNGIRNPLILECIDYQKDICKVKECHASETVTFTLQQCGSNNYRVWKYLKMKNLKIPTQQIQTFHNELYQWSPKAIIDANLHAIMSFLSSPVFAPFIKIKTVYHSP